MREAIRRTLVVLAGLAAVLAVVVIALTVYHVGGVDLPRAETVEKEDIEHPGQNWEGGWGLDQTQWFHHATQGTKILPYAWFMALERPELFPPGERKRFVDDGYLYRFGFLPSEPHPRLNPDSLPVGFAIEEQFHDPLNPKKGPYRVVGLTCAACHTGELQYKKDDGTLKAIRIEGGPAMINLALFQKAVGLALFYTNFWDARFNRFADRVLAEADRHDAGKRKELREELSAFLKTNMDDQSYANKKGLYALDLGFARTDALGLIGNRVFGPLDRENLNVANAPVNFPHLWDTPWFDWVQYNASIRMPMVRNIGEALGVGAMVKLDVPQDQRFPMTVNIENLHRIESQIGGSKPYSGLRSPKWGDTGLKPIEPHARDRGETLYRRYCMSCHFPPPKELEADLDSKKPEHWHPEGRDGGEMIRVLRMPVFDLEEIGTDPNQALNFYRRLALVAGETVSGAKGLYNVTGIIRKQFYKSKGFDQKQVEEYDRHRTVEDPAFEKQEYDLKNECVISQVIVPNLGYKARPLNGIWATAPFLHNGSVPNLYEVLVPVMERSATFYLGSKRFDEKNVGFEKESMPGGFRLDTSLSGNTNGGHEYRNLDIGEMERAMDVPNPLPGDMRPEDERWTALFGPAKDPDPGAGTRGKWWEKIRAQMMKMLKSRNLHAIPKGVIGPELTDDERWDLIAYLKSL